MTRAEFKNKEYTEIVNLVKQLNNNIKKYHKYKALGKEAIINSRLEQFKKYDNDAYALALIIDNIFNELTKNNIGLNENDKEAIKISGLYLKWNNQQCELKHK